MEAVYWVDNPSKLSIFIMKGVGFCQKLFCVCRDSRGFFS